MQLTLSQKALSSALDPVHRVVARKNTIPILSNVRLVATVATDDTPATLSLTGTDMDREITVTVGAEVVHPGETTVPAGLLLDIVRKLPSGAEITLSVDGESRQLSVSSGRSKFRLQCLPSGDFPDMPRRPATHSFTLSHTEIRLLLGRTAFAVSTDEVRYYLNGVFLHVADETGLLTGVGTCGHRLAVAETEAPLGSVGMPGVIMPSATVKEILKLVGKDDGEVEVRVHSEGVVFTIGSVEIYAKLIDGTFPQYRTIIPMANPQNLRIDRAALASAVDRVSTVTSDRGRGMKIELGAELVRLSMTAPDAGSSDEAVDARFDGLPFEIGFNAKYLSGILSEMEADAIEIALASPGEPALITGDEGVQIVLMPMRI